MKVAILATIALIAFSANSVLARLALGAGDMNAAGYTGVRIVSGALALTAILYVRARRNGDARIVINGSWRGAAALFGYALAFSIAYLMLGAGTGALILFASVQIGMLAWATLKGDRPGLLEWLGFGVAFAALIFLVAPGLVAPPLLGTALMVAAGLSWAAYSLLGQGSRAPLADTAGNFIRCVPIALVLVASSDLWHTSSTPGLAYAVASGAIASGLGLYHLVHRTAEHDPHQRCVHSADGSRPCCGRRRGVHRGTADWSLAGFVGGHSRRCRIGLARCKQA